MMTILALVFATLSIWDYPAKFPQHDHLRRQFIAALREGDTATMEETCRKGVRLLPDDPTWHYNLACSLAYFPKRSSEAFEELEKAIDLGFRDVEKIREDTDLKRLAKDKRYKESLEYAEFMKTRPIMLGPMANVPATGVFGRSVSLGEQNLAWDFDAGCFEGRLELVQGSVGANVGDLYMNRDGGHSRIVVTNFTGLTEVMFDRDGRHRHMDLNIPNVVFPYPTFGNCSMAYMGQFWRSIPRALMTKECGRLPALQKMYLSNQLWFFPSNADTAPIGTNGDVFASIAPFWLTTAGRSWSDRPYLEAALRASGALQRPVKQEIVRRRLLAPTLFTLLRKSLGTVLTEDDYLTSRAHPTAFPPGGLDVKRLLRTAAALKVEEIPPLATVTVALSKPKKDPLWPEITYATPLACAIVLRAEDAERSCLLRARGAGEYAFVQTHGDPKGVRIESTGADSARVTIERAYLTPTSRVDIAVMGRNPGTGWGAPAYVSFARMDPEAPYSDPVLTPLPPPAEK